MQDVAEVLRETLRVVESAAAVRQDSPMQPHLWAAVRAGLEAALSATPGRSDAHAFAPLPITPQHAPATAPSSPPPLRRDTGPPLRADSPPPLEATSVVSSRASTPYNIFMGMLLPLVRIRNSQAPQKENMRIAAALWNQHKHLGNAEAVAAAAVEELNRMLFPRDDTRTLTV